MGGTRLEPIAASSIGGGSSDDGPRSCEAESEADLPKGGQSAGDPPAPADPDLACLIAAWPALPQPIRAGMLAMVSEATNDRTGDPAS